MSDGVSTCEALFIIGGIVAAVLFSFKLGYDEGWTRAKHGQDDDE